MSALKEAHQQRRELQSKAGLSLEDLEKELELDWKLTEVCGRLLYAFSFIFIHHLLVGREGVNANNSDQFNSDRGDIARILGRKQKRIEPEGSEHHQRYRQHRC